MRRARVRRNLSRRAVDFCSGDWSTGAFRTLLATATALRKRVHRSDYTFTMCGAAFRVRRRGAHSSGHYALAAGKLVCDNTCPVEMRRERIAFAKESSFMCAPDDTFGEL